MAVVTPNIAPFINVTFYVTGEYGEIRPYETHVGLDIATTNPENLYSIFNGTVIDKNFTNARGNYIIVKDNSSNLAFLYQHMANPSNKNVGDSVQIGELVGIEGTTGQVTGMHLHMEMQDLTGRNWYFGNDINYYLNPATYMGIPNIRGTECYYNGIPIFPSQKSKKFNWAVFTRPIRKRRNIL